jgi:transcriptional regulator with XRE-family HTH domain
MNLDQYLLLNGISVRAFARACGTSASSIVRIRRREVIPTLRVMEAIHTATNGQVAPADLVPTSFQPIKRSGDGEIENP